MHKTVCDFEIITNHQISARRLDLVIVNEKRTSRIVDMAVLANHRVKIKENEKKKSDEYLDLVRERKKLRNMKVTVVQIVIGALRTIPKGAVKGLEGFEIIGRAKTIQIASLLKSARILRRVLEI